MVIRSDLPISDTGNLEEDTPDGREFGLDGAVRAHPSRAPSPPVEGSFPRARTKCRLFAKHPRDGELTGKRLSISLGPFLTRRLKILQLLREGGPHGLPVAFGFQCTGGTVSELRLHGDRNVDEWKKASVARRAKNRCRVIYRPYFWR